MLVWLAYVCTVHAAVLLHRPLLGLVALTAWCAVQFLVSLSVGGRRRRLAWGAAAIVPATALALALAGHSAALAVVLVPPVLINLALFVLFGRTLLPGQEPLIARFARIEQGDLPPPLYRYTRRLTAGWMALFAAMTVAALLATFADPATWSTVTNIICPLLAAALFLGEHPYRGWRFRQYGPASPLRTLRTMLRRETWATS